MSPITIRRATVTDLGDMVRLLADDELGRAREDTSPTLNPQYVAAFHAIDAEPHQLLVVLEQHEHVIGCLQLSFFRALSRLGALRGQIEGVRIDSVYRGNGFGRAMIQWSIAECRRRGCGSVQLTTDKSRLRALRFYQSLGFVASHEGMKFDLSR